MRTTGQELIDLALDRALVPGEGHDEVEVTTLVRHSKTLLNSLNREPSTAVGGVVRVETALPAGSSSFTWGPPPSTISTADYPLPSNIVAWNAIDAAGQEYPRGARMLSSAEFANLQFEKETTSNFLSYLYWPRTLDDAGRYTFYFWPKTEGAATDPPTPGTSSIALYATIPKLETIEIGTTYEIDDGRAEFLVTQLALLACDIFRFQASPQLRGAAREAAIRLGAFAREDNTLHVPSRRYLIGGRRHWRGLRLGL